MRVLVCGGAGYLGSVAVRKLIEAGHEVLVFDNFSTGHRESIHPSVEVIEGDLRTKESLESTLKLKSFSAVVHLASDYDEKKAYENPYFYLGHNYSVLLNLLDAMKITGVKKLVVASSASIYGVVESNPVKEESKMVVSSPLGESFYAMEKALGWYDYISQIKTVCLRMADFGGASIDGNLGEDKKEGLGVVSQAVKASLTDGVFRLNGNNYQTLDGTLVRDYLHVEDAAVAILRSLEFLTSENRSEVFNISCGKPYSIKEVVAEVQAQSGKELNIVPAVRKRGDKDVIYLDISKALRELSFAPAYDLGDMVQTSLYFYARHSEGY